MCTYPAGVDDDDDVEESLHFGVLPLVWLEGVLGAAASGELFTEGDVDEGAPRYLGGNTFSDNVSVSQEIIMMTMMMIDDDNHIGHIMTLNIPSGNREPFHGSSNAFLIRIELAEPVLWNLIIVTMMIMMIMMIMRIML